MIKEMTISIQVSGETKQDCDTALVEALADIQDELQWSEKAVNKWDRGNLNEGEEEMHWSYEIKTVNDE